MIRPNLPNNFNYKTSDLIFQIIDWKSYDINILEENDNLEEETEKNKIKKLIIRGYGVTENGNSICIHINGFEPYFYFKIPQHWDEKMFKEFKYIIKNLVIEKEDDNNIDGLINAYIIKKKEFYGFTNNKLFNYGIFIFKNQKTYYSYLKILKEEKILMKDSDEMLDFSDKLYETKVSSLLRFFHVKNIDPSGWLKINGGKYSKNIPSITRAQIDISIHYNDIIKIEKNDVGQILVASFDIECLSEDGSFPKFDRKNDPVIQIGTTVYIFGENECKYRYIATLNKCDSIENTEVESYQNEKDLILGWAKFMERIDPDIITGYNIWGFDWEYIYKRAESGNGGICKPYHNELFKKLQRIKLDKTFFRKVELKIQDLSSSALGVNILKYIDIEGVVQIDLLKVVQRDYKLDSYKLDNVAKHFMKQQKVDLSPKELFNNFRIGTSDKIKEIAVYCIMDCKLVNDLINKLQVITNNLGMSNVCIVPFSYLFLRGQGIKIFSLVAKFCREEDFLIKDLSPDDIDKNSYEGAIVFVPTPGIYLEPVVVMDYNSLYPSSMIAENISHDSIIGYKEFIINKKNEYDLVKNTIKEEYDNLEGFHYIDIEYDIFQGLDEDKKKVGYKVCRFAEADNGEKSVLPRILRKLLKARKDTRKIMEYKTLELKDGTFIEGIPTEKEDKYEIFNVNEGKRIIEKEMVLSLKATNNEFQISVLDGLQLAFKVTCNSLYGQVGATTSPICFKELAACTTATGRRMVITARDLTLNTFVGAKLTYGDSVTGDTPLLVMKNGFIDIVSIEELNNEWMPYNEFKPMDTNRKEKEQTNSNYKIWTKEGWSKINRVIRHKTNKKIFRIRTNIGIVDVTEDHSLLDIHKNSIKPESCKINETELLHDFPLNFNEYFYNDQSLIDMENIIENIRFGKIDKIPISILNAKCKDRIIFVKMLMNKYKLKDLQQSSKIFDQSIYYLLKSIEKEVSEVNNYISTLKLNGSKEIIECEFLYNSEDIFVYDIETVSGNFQAGVGQLIVKNTDSIFVNFTDEIKRRYPDRNFTEKELLEESIKIGEEAAANINKNIKSPQNIEYEKTFWPFCIFSKKRYFGNKYEHNIEKYKQTSMGIVLKRRDNAPLVKTIYGGVIDIILNKRDIEASKTFFYNSIEQLLEGKVDISQLVISKTVKNDYANPNQIAHKVLADRMGERDPGNKPQSNDRIPYCYIDTCNLNCKICNNKINHEKCKCIACMNIFCFTHLNNHREVCNKICRFCKMNDKNKIEKCNICNGWYCEKCNIKHKIRTDKYKEKHNDKCKKPLTNKLLQGDTIEHPLYIGEKNLKIDFNYYLTHQIEKPVYQIFELVMKNPSSIIEDLVRKMNNAKNGNSSIKNWFKIMDKKIKEDGLVPNLMEKIVIDDKTYNEEENMLSENFEEDIIENLDDLKMEDNDIE